MIKLYNDFERISDMFGSLEGVGRGLSSTKYTHKLIRQAHKKATNAFDLAAAATAATGQFPHVYEFGVAGITPGPPRIQDPTSPAARLWVHRIIGKGREQDISFVFRPASVANPKPTPETTGVPAKYLAKLSKTKYIFWNKATVMETGMEVQNKSVKDHGYLFLPFRTNAGVRGEEPTGKGFVLWDTNRKGLPPPTVPGKGTRGTFTAFWMTWWASEGEYVINSSMKEQTNIHIEQAELRAARSATKHSLKSATLVNIPSTARTAAAAASKAFGRGKRW